MSWLRSATSWSLLQHAAAPVVALCLIAGAPPGPVPSATDAAMVDRAVLLERQAVELAHELRAVPADPTEALCARNELQVRWDEPAGYAHGAHVGDIGPRPGPTTENVNGVVVCGSSTWAYMGFEAQWTGSAWRLAGVPYLEDEHGDVAALNLDAGPVRPADHAHEPVTPPADVPAAAVTTPRSSPSPGARVPTSAWLAGLGPIEGYASYDPQTTCTPTARPGTVVVRDILLGVHAGTRNLGIVRACHVGGRSEHKEGRAFDWGAHVSRPVERAAVERFITQLHATDAEGNAHALARRMGVMYLVWNGQIWSAYRASEGWRPYRGPNPHTDHLHISFSRAGADARTSFFTAGLAAQGVLGQLPPGSVPAPAAPATPVTTVPTGDTGARPQPSTPATPRPPDDRAEPRSPTPATDPDGRQPRPERDEATRTSPGPDTSAEDDRRRDAERQERETQERERQKAEDAARREQERQQAEQRRQEELQRREDERQQRHEERRSRTEPEDGPAASWDAGAGDRRGPPEGRGRGR